MQRDEQAWIDRGVAANAAADKARYRIFGSKPGAYGTGIGGLIDTVVGGITREAKYEDLLVATKYTVTSGGKTALECLGAFSQFFCSKPEAK